MSNRIQVRNWCFTINNPEQTDDEFHATLEQLQRSGVAKYAVWQRERGEEGTVHIQGFVSFSRSRDLGFCSRHIDRRAHFEPAKGTPAQNKAYCNKTDTRLDGHDPHEHGECPVGQGQRSDLARVGKRIREGETVSGIALEFDDDFSTLLRNRRHFEWLELQLNKRHCQEKTVLWIHGPTGTGKSRLCHDTYPNAFWKLPNCKWFDGYGGEDVVILDDYRESWNDFGYSVLLRITDRYPVMVEVKGGSMPLRAKTIVITSNHPPRNAFDLDPAHENIDQLLRRITEIKELGDPENDVGGFNGGAEF